MIEYHSDNLSIEYQVIDNNLNYSLSYLSFRRETYNFFSAAAESLIIVKFLNLTVMKKFILSALVLGAPLFAGAWTLNIVCEDGSTHQRETVSPEFYQNEDGSIDEEEMVDYYMEFADLVCSGKG